VTTYSPGDGKWILSPKATELRQLRDRWNDDQYEKQKQAIKNFLCAYFSTHGDCRNRQGNSIVPIMATPKGGKVLKMRWAFPGCGKSGGLRLVVVAYCDKRRVVIAEGVARRDSLPSEFISDAVSDL